MFLASLAATLIVIPLAAQTLGRPVTVTEGLGYFPVAIRLKNGDILAVLRGGAPHIGVKGRLDLVRSTDGGRTWSKPWTVADEAEDDRNPALGQLRDGTVILGYVVARGYDETGLRFKGKRQDWIFEGVYLTRSRDNGKTWTKPERSQTTYDFYNGKGAISPYGKIVQTKDGAALMAVYFEFHDDRGNESYVFRSTDGGKTWGQPALIGRHYNETGLAVLKDGSIVAALRSEKGGNLATSFSSDGGRTWSTPTQVTADREHPADLIQLSGGRLLMTFGERNEPRGARAVISSDNGKTWSTQTPFILANDAPNGDTGYPSSVETAPGRITTLYYRVDDLKRALETSKCIAVLWEIPK